MRKFSAIVLLFVFACTNEVGQLLKLPLLISHFAEHYREERQSIDDFFHEHYVHHHGSTNKDQEKDDQLPFKTSSIQLQSFSYMLPALEKIDEPSAPMCAERLILPSIFICTNYLKDIFHPPQIV